MQALANFVTGSPAAAATIWEALFPAALTSIASCHPGVHT